MSHSKWLWRHGVPGLPKLPAAAGIAVPRITAADDVWGLGCSRGSSERGRGGTERVARKVCCGKATHAVRVLPSLACESPCCSLPPPPCDKPRRECGEPTFTTGTSAASLLNPVSGGYQHRAGNVMRPAAAATSARRDAVRAPRGLGSSVHTAEDSHPQVPVSPQLRINRNLKPLPVDVEARGCSCTELTSHVLSGTFEIASGT